jgi:hypothetical protein
MRYEEYQNDGHERFRLIVQQKSCKPRGFPVRQQSKCFVTDLKDFIYDFYSGPRHPF